MGHNSQASCRPRTKPERTNETRNEHVEACDPHPRRGALHLQRQRQRLEELGKEEEVVSSQAQDLVRPQVGGPQAQDLEGEEVVSSQAQGLVCPQVGDQEVGLQEVGLQEEGLQVGLLLSRLRFARDTRRWCPACCMPCPSSRLALLFPLSAVSGRSDRTVRPSVRPLPCVMLALANTTIVLGTLKVPLLLFL